MCAAATQATQYSVSSSTLLLAFELGQKTWKLGFAVVSPNIHGCARAAAWIRGR